MTPSPNNVQKILQFKVLMMSYRWVKYLPVDPKKN